MSNTESEKNRTEKGILVGRNAVQEALRSGRQIDCLYMQRPPYTGSLGQIASLAAKKKILIKEAGRAKLDEMAGGENHQGVIASVAVMEYVDVETILDKARSAGQAPLLILCESIQDPHNLGAILRSAEACGAHGVIISRRHAVGLTAAVARCAVGAEEYVPVAKVGNMAQTIEELKRQGVWIAAADMDGTPAYATDLGGPLALVIGGEHEGVSRLVREKSDYIVSIPMCGQINSLNASVAAGMLLYEVMRQRKSGGCA